MKIRTTLVLASALCALSLSGCASTATAPRPTAELGAAGLRIATSTGATMALNKNPEYVGVAAALATTIEGSLVSQSNITPQVIGEYVAFVCKQHNVAREDIALWVNLAQTVYAAYVTAYKPAVVSGSDPNVILYALAFADGLRDAIAAIHLSRQADIPRPPVPVAADIPTAAGEVTRRLYFGACGAPAIGRV
jgi:ABC-type amino acid transport substrate-binding protein